MALQAHHLGQVAYEPTYVAMQAFTATRTENTPDELWICEHTPVYTQGLAGKTEHIFNPGNIPVVQTNRGGQVTHHGPGQVVAYPLIDLKRAGYFVKEYVYRIEEAVIRTLMHFGVTGHRVAGAPGIYVRLDDPASHALLPQRPQKTVHIAPELASMPLCSEAMAVQERSGENPAAQRNGSDIKLSELKPHASTPNFTGLGKIAALGIKVSRNCTYHGVALNVAMDLEPYSRINPCGYSGLQTVDLSTIGVHASWQEVAELFSQKLTTYLTP
ncbi:MAG: lipoyl(octanoyl) transferase LipB [Rhodoferax sp.]|uniref:lipoyl(octanoyl) transferase LipB n=1 Tax=Rhodoferax sp. TaxID=50421 RepID=UPI00260A9F70|nr:lipoyl(octanoyl) transferase LipB [Rhodoferax sp.]MDD2882778.1 lipoyl(octanoyl) transferase LipB [Rhodoferax sp.]